MSNNIFVEAEQKLALNSVKTPAFFGVSKGNWSTWKHGKVAPEYVIRSIEGHLLLPQRTLTRLKKERDK